LLRYLYPIGSMVLVKMLTLGVYWWSMLPYIAYMDPMGMWSYCVSSESSVVSSCISYHPIFW
jgi:hypothetical protein